MYNMTKGEAPEGNTVTYEYNKNYQEVLATNAEGATISYEYDTFPRGSVMDLIFPILSSLYLVTPPSAAVSDVTSPFTL